MHVACQRHTSKNKARVTFIVVRKDNVSYNAERILKDSATDRHPANDDHDVGKNQDKCIQPVSTSTRTDDVFHDDQ